MYEIEPEILKLSSKVVSPVITILPIPSSRVGFEILFSPNSVKFPPA